MFGRPKIVKAIKKGDLEQVKQILRDDPDILGRDFKWSGYKQASLLHMAASCNQTEIIKFLADKGMDLDRKYYGCTPLHYAVQENSYQTVQALLSLGADASLRDNGGKIPYDVCKDKATRQLLFDWEKERQRQRELAEQEKERQQRIAAIRIEGRWRLVSSGDIILERDMPEHTPPLTEIFGMAAEPLARITEGLDAKQIPPSVKKFFDEMAEQKRVDQTHAPETDTAVEAVLPAAPRRAEPRVAELARQRFI